MTRMFRIFLLCTALYSALSCPLVAQAQTPGPVADPQRPTTIPVEVAFIYAKLLNTQPDFLSLATNSPTVQNTPEFGRDALIAQERNSLESIFKTIKRDKLIIVRDTFQIDTIAPSLQTIRFKDIDADTPFTFETGSTAYGVFMRNAQSMVLPLQGPFYKGGDWVTLQKMSLDHQAPLIELTLQPLGADADNFTTFKDQIVKPIIADLIEIKVYDPKDPTKLLLDKRDEKAFSAASSQLENLVQDDVKDTDLMMPSTTGASSLPSPGIAR